MDQKIEVPSFRQLLSVWRGYIRVLVTHRKFDKGLMHFARLQCCVAKSMTRMEAHVAGGILLRTRLQQIGQNRIYLIRRNYSRGLLFRRWHGVSGFNSYIAYGAFVRLGASAHRVVPATTLKSLQQRQIHAAISNDGRRTERIHFSIARGLPGTATFECLLSPAPDSVPPWRARRS